MESTISLENENNELLNDGSQSVVEKNSDVVSESIHKDDMLETFKEPLIEEEKSKVEENVIADEKIFENINNSSDNFEKSDETSVRRLSLFDTLSADDNLSDQDNNSLNSKSEPILNSLDETQSVSEASNEEGINENEFNPEENEDSESQDEFNQETEEELLDIPTFLRRQAN